MARRRIGSVGAIWRYPVKSMRGESLERAELTERGLAGDRRFALRELERGGIMSARTWPTILNCSASYQGDPSVDRDARVMVQFADGTVVKADDSEIAERLSALLQRKVRVERVRHERLTEKELDEISRGVAFPPSRDFFDEDVLHIVASGTLQYMRTLEPASDFDPRRFRANVYIDTGDEKDGFIEDRWLEGVLEIGANAKIVGIRPAIRCAMTTHPQWELRHDPAILRTAWQHHRAYVGVFAAVGTPGWVRVGDAVHLES